MSASGFLIEVVLGSGTYVKAPHFRYARRMGHGRWRNVESRVYPISAKGWQMWANEG